MTYDSDGAGIKAALRAIPILKDGEISVKVLDMQPYKDPDEFMKNLGPEAFKERIAQAKNSFLYEIAVLRKQYDMEDPEQKTEFYQETAKKLLEFPEALERDNYIQAVSREQFIPYEVLRCLNDSLPGAEERSDTPEMKEAAVIPGAEERADTPGVKEAAGMLAKEGADTPWKTAGGEKAAKKRTRTKAAASPSGFCLPG